MLVLILFTNYIIILCLGIYVIYFYCCGLVSLAGLLVAHNTCSNNIFSVDNNIFQLFRRRIKVVTIQKLYLYHRVAFQQGWIGYQETAGGLCFDSARMVIEYEKCKVYVFFLVLVRKT